MTEDERMEKISIAKKSIYDRLKALIDVELDSQDYGLIKGRSDMTDETKFLYKLNDEIGIVLLDYIVSKPKWKGVTMKEIKNET